MNKKHWIYLVCVFVLSILMTPLFAQKGNLSRTEAPPRTPETVAKARGLKAAPNNRQVSKLPKNTPVEKKMDANSDRRFAKATVKPYVMKPKPQISTEEKIQRLLKEIDTLKKSNDPQKAAKIEKLEKVLEKRRREKIFEDNQKIQSKPKPKPKKPNMK